MKGLSVWIFSKMVMLIFLIVTFATVTGFLRLSNDRVMADSAEALAMQVKDTMHATLYTTTVSSRSFITLPKTLPESSQNTQTGKPRAYTLALGESRANNAPDSEQVIYAAVGWGEKPDSFVAASSFRTSGTEVTPQKCLLFSTDDRYLLIEKGIGNSGQMTLSFKKCTSFDESMCGDCS
jgi:hypothetical protein